MTRRYYSQRIKKLPELLDVSTAGRLFFGIYKDFEDKGYLQEHFGYSCVDAGDIAGRIGLDVSRYVLRKLRRDDVWPISDGGFSEEQLFDVIGFLFDHISKPSGGRYHSFANCGQHYSLDDSEFDSTAAHEEYRSEVNHLLADYDSGYELSEEGEILALPESGMEHLLSNRMPSIDSPNVEARVERAILKFRRYRSSHEEKRAAVRELADVLEFLRPRLKQVLAAKDEADLFNIANNFAVRHHNAEQKTQYDQDIWLPWMFYFYLATIHAATRLIKRRSVN